MPPSIFQVNHQMIVIHEPDVRSKSNIGRLLSKTAVDLDACAIVVASHSTERIEEALIGSVTHWLIHYCERCDRQGWPV